MQNAKWSLVPPSNSAAASKAFPSGEGGIQIGPSEPIWMTEEVLAQYGFAETLKNMDRP